MQPTPRASGRSTRLALLATALVVLLAVVAFASRSGFGHAGRASPNSTYVNYAFSVFLILFVLMIPVAIWSMIMRARESDPRDRPSPLRQFLRTVSIIVFFTLISWIIYRAHLHFHVPKNTAGAHTATGKAHGKPHATQPAQQTSPTFEWTVLWVALGLGAVGLVLLAMMWRRWKQRTITPGPTVAEEMAATIGEAIADLESEPDPRRAVIAAYARMERELGRHGLARRPSETAIEYLRRVLLDLTSSGAAVERLTALFERAKFSNHEITQRMKHEAIQALGEIRDGLGQ